MNSHSTARASVILSFDFEIGWGDVTNPRWRFRQEKGVYKKLRKVLPEILDVMDQADFRATWASVGAMFDKPENRDFSHLPNQYQELIHSVLKQAEPESFDGQDLFEMLLSAKTSHLVASHSYSHVPFTYEYMSEDVVRHDIERFNAALAKYGRSADRFVFPENREAHYKALADTGYKKMRVAADNHFKNRYIYLASTMILPPPNGIEEPGEENLVRQYGSMSFNDAGQAWKVKLLKRRVSLGLKQLERSGGVLHIWAHPFNFAESDPLKYAFMDMIKQIAILRDKGKLTIDLM
jgi:peptidoglycan/xylan/chitin deacetylase (PgdA/CDA1 family)